MVAHTPWDPGVWDSFCKLPHLSIVFTASLAASRSKPLCRASPRARQGRGPVSVHPAVISQKIDLIIFPSLKQTSRQWWRYRWMTLAFDLRWELCWGSEEVTTHRKCFCFFKNRLEEQQQSCSDWYSEASLNFASERKDWFKTQNLVAHAGLICESVFLEVVFVRNLRLGWTKCKSFLFLLPLGNLFIKHDWMNLFNWTFSSKYHQSVFCLDRQSRAAQEPWDGLDSFYILKDYDPVQWISDSKFWFWLWFVCNNFSWFFEKKSKTM